MWCSELGIGGMKVTGTRSDFRIEWVIFEGGIKSELKQAEWNALCSDPALEMHRLEVGLVVCAVLQAQGQKVMDTIGHPIAAFNEAKPYRDAADEWKHWAMVKPGHMIGL